MLLVLYSGHIVQFHYMCVILASEPEAVDTIRRAYELDCLATSASNDNVGAENQTDELLVVSNREKQSGILDTPPMKRGTHCNAGAIVAVKKARRLADVISFLAGRDPMYLL
jgi:hypothetical protein